ncbi:oxidoreductase family protein [Irpex rosettiformis]|uniref:Oxidoreductase family protein n=1 Tax=Irpex rosettiformis TaxID=378272 RepID=A0ACB8U4Y6_9APHY|nr:oxidoreductase family protein [Irpex rosettiformis]
MSPKRIAILGSGIFAKEAHLPAVAALHSNGTVELIAIYSRSEASAADLANAAKDKLNLSNPPEIYFDAAPNNNLDALLAKPDIDGVIVALPITVQPSIVRKALAAGKHVLSEKPVAPDVAGGIALINDYEKQYKSKGLVWRVAENWEVEPGYHAAAKAIRDGKIGKVAFFNARVVNYMAKDNKWYNTPWRTVPDYQGGFLLDGGVHTIAALRITLPSPLSTLSAFASLSQPHLKPQDTINAIVSTSDGAHGLIELTWGAPVPSRVEQAHSGITITGTEGWINIENTALSNGTRGIRVSVYTVTKDEKGRDVGESKEVVEEESVGVNVEVARFVEAIDGKDDGYGKGVDALKDVAFIEAALNSNGKPVDLLKLIEF